jgi:hypothetical protein
MPARNAINVRNAIANYALRKEVRRVRRDFWVPCTAPVDSVNQLPHHLAALRAFCTHNNISAWFIYNQEAPFMYRFIEADSANTVQVPCG